ncbi:flagellar brake protein [Caldimonas brevitalea]|uniref:Inner membrane protein n=1 Tax=Caldimonas brevitalea TaxID=413882 RepID=A0A0G3BDT0_9BURK|nr:PilZ domain-containing protein [Caldimonas brevitalea]AKJ27447.1 inner membrane protein [Caldimonas brevitalea]
MGQPPSIPRHPTAPPIAPAEPIGNDIDVGPYRLTDPVQIGVALQALATAAEAVTAYPPDIAASVLGRVTSVDMAARRWTFETLVETPVPDGAALFVAISHGIKLQFGLDVVQWQLVPGQPTRATCPFPAELIKLQRREFHRLDAPLGRPYVAEFTLHGQHYALNVYDLSLGGVGLRAAPHEAVGLSVGRRLSKVRLELGHGELLVVDLDIRLRRAFRSYLLGEQFHIGCRFVDLATTTQADLKRITGQLETERQALNSAKTAASPTPPPPPAGPRPRRS